MVENKKILVLDASVLIKWIILETEGRALVEEMKIQYLKGEIGIHIPGFALWEVNNYLGRNNSSIAITLFSQLQMYHFEEHHLTLEVTSIAFEIMHSTPKISFYDASYHALALSTGGTFVTADKGYYNKAKKWKHIKLLK